MAIYYSSLYKAPPNGDQTVKIYEGPHGLMSVGGTYMVKGSLTIPAATFTAGDSAKLCKVPENVKLLRFYAVPSGDLDAGNTFTFNLGWVSAANAFASASTGLQAATAYKIDADAVINAAAAIDGDELVLTRVAGALAAGTIAFVAEFGQ